MDTNLGDLSYSIRFVKDKASADLRALEAEADATIARIKSKFSGVFGNGMGQGQGGGMPSGAGGTPGLAGTAAAHEGIGGFLGNVAGHRIAAMERSKGFSRLDLNAAENVNAAMHTTVRSYQATGTYGGSVTSQGPRLADETESGLPGSNPVGK